MSSFDAKWEQFIEEKGFKGFMDEYHGRWLHSYVFFSSSPFFYPVFYNVILTFFFSAVTYLADKTFFSPPPNPTLSSVSSVSPQTTVFSAVSPSPTNLKPLPVSHPCTTGTSTLARMIVVLGFLLFLGLEELPEPKRIISHRLWTSSRMGTVLI